MIFFLPLSILGVAALAYSWRTGMLLAGQGRVTDFFGLRRPSSRIAALQADGSAQSSASDQ
ncbi:hypothetical protein [Comamonas composti]|uniref:hypothetical protein n=1 Tax=Comamonas composti TaxID=408558 RepID=UPI00047DC26D|nr:hypothetical protein [Comamonas composti]